MAQRQNVARHLPNNFENHKDAVAWRHRKILRAAAGTSISAAGPRRNPRPAPLLMPTNRPRCRPLCRFRSSIPNE